MDSPSISVKGVLSPVLNPAALRSRMGRFLDGCAASSSLARLAHS